MLKYLLVLVFVESCVGSKLAKTTELLGTLLTNYSTVIRPGLDSKGPLVINLTFNLVVLTEINEVKGFMSTVGFLDVNWTDERIKWDPEVFSGISSLSVDSEQVWKPELVISNPADRVYHFTELSTTVTYSSDGVAHWRAGSVMKTVCFLQIPTYPFDVHTCYIDVISWGTQPSEIMLATHEHRVKRDLYSDGAEWELKATTCGVNGSHQFSMVSFGLTFGRKPLFLIVNILIPIVFLSILNSVVFLLPHESGERVTFSITILLSFTVFLNVIGDNLPKTSSSLPFLCHYVIFVLLTSGFITLLVILCQRLYHIRGREPVPRWLLKYVCLSSKYPENTTAAVVPRTEDGKDNGRVEHVSCDTVTTWRLFVLTIDNFLFWFFFIEACCSAFGFIFSMANMQS